MILEKIFAFGHENILCSHKTTIELTKHNYLTKRGNCVLGINASKGCIDLNEDLKQLIKDKKKIKVTIMVGELSDSFYGFGDNELKLLDENDIVFRKSSFICDRTILINCTKSSNDLNRDLIEKLKISGNQFIVLFEIEDDV